MFYMQQIQRVAITHARIANYVSTTNNTELWYWQASRYEPSLQVSNPVYLVPVPSQDKWEGCGRKGIRHKIGGMMEVGASIVQISWSPAGLSVHLPVLSSPRLTKSRMMTDSRNTFQV